MQKTFDDLIRYLKKESPKKLDDAPDFELVERFAKMHGINPAEIKDVFLGFGATCDDEWDATRIPENTKIGDEVEVPFEAAGQLVVKQAERTKIVQITLTTAGLVPLHRQVRPANSLCCRAG